MCLVTGSLGGGGTIIVPASVAAPPVRHSADARLAVRWLLISALQSIDPTVGSWLGNDSCISLSSLHAVNDKKHLFVDCMKYMG